MPTAPYRLLIAALLLLGGAATTVRAGEKVKVVVIAVLATSQDKKVDPKLKCIAEQVHKVEPKLTGFRLARTSAKALMVGKSEKFPLVDETFVTVTLDRAADDRNRVSVTVKPPKLGTIAYTSCCGKFFPIVTRYHTKNKERLIIGIMVETCNQDK